MVAGARASLVLLALLLGCAQGSSVESTSSPFGVGSSASTTAMSTTAVAHDTSSGSETQGTGSDPSTGTDGCDDPSCNATCGNGMLDPGEACDGDALDGNDCVAQGFVGGVLGCNDDCSFDTSGCTSASCGDAMVQDGEDCDCGPANAPCTAAQLGGQSCTSRAAPSGGGNYSGGTLGCGSPASCTFDESACVWCGNGVLDAMESCDGANLGGASCANQGFDTGNLSCAANCTFNTAGCMNFVCGDGSCNGTENTCSCAQDCPNDPNSCDSPCECGGYGGACFCDDLCLEYGDCCANGPC